MPGIKPVTTYPPSSPVLADVTKLPAALKTCTKPVVTGALVAARRTVPEKTRP